jgi:hypothetical protein
MRRAHVTNNKYEEMQVIFIILLILMSIATSAQRLKYTVDTVPPPRLTNPECDCSYENFDGGYRSYIDNFLHCINRTSFGDTDENFVRFWTSSKPREDTLFFKLKMIEFGRMINDFYYPVNSVRIYEVEWKIEKSDNGDKKIVFKSFSFRNAKPKVSIATLMDVVKNKKYPILKGAQPFSWLLMHEFRLNAVQKFNGATTVMDDYSIEKYESKWKVEFIKNYLSLGRYLEVQLDTDLYLPLIK